MLYLRSDQAETNYGPCNKSWLIAQMDTTGKHHNVVVRSLQIMHLFPNVKTDVFLNTGTKTVTIPAGNYHPCVIARYLNDKLYPEVQTVCWDQEQALFRFCPSISITSDSTAQKLLGFQSGTAYTNVTQSVLPAHVYGPTRIIVETNLQLYNIPISGRLAVIPITQKYGEMIDYNNFASTYNHLCMDHVFSHLHIRLTDENGDDLTGYDDIPWDILISFEPMENPGYQIQNIISQ